MPENQDNQRRSLPPLMVAAWESAISEPDPLTALGSTRALIGLLSTWEAKLAVEAVASGATWETIGGSLGVSRQAAWEHFHDHVDEFKRQVKLEAHAIRDRHKQELHQFRSEVIRRANEFRRP